MSKKILSIYFARLLQKLNTSNKQIKKHLKKKRKEKCNKIL